MLYPFGWLYFYCLIRAASQFQESVMGLRWGRRRRSRPPWRLLPRLWRSFPAGLTCTYCVGFVYWPFGPRGIHTTLLFQATALCTGDRARLACALLQACLAQPRALQWCVLVAPALRLALRVVVVFVASPSVLSSSSRGAPDALPRPSVLRLPCQVLPLQSRNRFQHRCTPLPSQQFMMP
jgi:hypothetical protein